MINGADENSKTDKLKRLISIHGVIRQKQKIDNIRIFVFVLLSFAVKKPNLTSIFKFTFCQGFKNSRGRDY